MTLRIATKDDFDLCFKFLSNLVDDKRFKHFSSNPDILKHMVNSYLDEGSRNEQLALIMSQDDKDIGVAAFKKVSVYGIFNAATVVVVYLEPDYRHQGYMKEFEEALEYWGKLVGCSHCYMGSSDIDYTKHGYERYEVMYIKEIK